MSDRFFLECSSRDCGLVTLSTEESHHLTRVLRRGVGAEVVLFSGDGEEWDGTVVNVQRKTGVVVRIDRLREKLPELTPRLTVAIALPKGERQRYLIEKLTELGCHRLVPVRTQRADIVADDGTLTRLRRWSLEAAKQCQRCRLMEIVPEVPLSKFLVPNDLDAVTLRLIPHPKSDADCGQHRIRDYLEGQSGIDHVIVLVGPAGGFTDDEVTAAINAGWQPTDLGVTRLRTETAAIAAAAKVAEFQSAKKHTAPVVTSPTL